jgi:ubiquinone/menaquinone biosynthesis C-methylase UbiE
VTSTRARTRANYDRLSRWYDLFAGSSERKYCEIGLRRLDVRPGEQVLEIGPGTGHALLALAQAVGATGAAWGVDLSQGMCRVARERLAHAELSPLATLLCGDAISLPFPADALDAIFMSFTLELFEDTDMARVLDECRRVLREDGRLGVVALAETGRSSPMTRLYGWAHHRFPDVVDCRPIRVTDALTRSGFYVNSVTRGSLWGLPVEIALAGKSKP